MTQELSTKQEPTYMQITVAGTTYDCKAQDFKIESLKLDPGNGRLQHLSEQLSQEEAFETLSDEPDTKKLKDSISHFHGLMEQPYVKLLPGEDNFEALLREGNRRKVALQLILTGIETGKLKLDRKDYETVKVWVYPSHMPDEHQLLHVANMHYSGKKGWAKLNQAAFITSLRDNDKITDDDIVKGLQVSKSSLQKQAKAYRQTMKYGKTYSNVDNGWKEKYSHFERLFTQKDLKVWCSDPKNMDLYMEWIINGRIPYAHKVAQIKTILLEPKLLKKFTEARLGGTSWKLEDALLDAEKNQKIKDMSKMISRKCDQAVEDLHENLPNLPTHKLDDLVGSKLLDRYVECISELQKYVDTVNATKKR